MALQGQGQRRWFSQLANIIIVEQVSDKWNKGGRLGVQYIIPNVTGPMNLSQPTDTWMKPWYDSNIKRFVKKIILYKEEQNDVSFNMYIDLNFSWIFSVLW